MMARSTTASSGPEPAALPVLYSSLSGGWLPPIMLVATMAAMHDEAVLKETP